MGIESERDKGVDKVNTVHNADDRVADNEDHTLNALSVYDGKTYGKGINQQIGSLLESPYSDLIKQGTLPTVDFVEDGNRSALYSYGIPTGDVRLRVNDKDDPRYADGTPKSGKPMEPHFAGHPDLAGDEQLIILPPQYTELPVADTKPQFAGHPDLAGDEQLQVRPGLTELPTVDKLAKQQ